MKWISVKDRIPDHEHEVLIVIQGPKEYWQQYGLGYLCGFLRKKRKWQLSSKCCSNLDEGEKVTYWAELPELPSQVAKSDENK